MSAAARLPALVVFTGAFALYATTACRTVFFGDAGELIAAADSLGVAHPPGYPLYTLLGWLALKLPLGEAALRVNLLSASCGAAACACVAWIVGRWSGSALAAIGAGLVLAASGPLWAVSTVAEVYALHLLLLGLLLAAATRLGEGGAGSRHVLLLAAVALGAGLAHRPTIVLALPAAAWLAWRREPERRFAPGVAVAAALCVVGIPLLLYGSLIVRARTGPLVHWGQVDQLGRLLDHVGTRAYGHYVLGAAGWSRPEAWATGLRQVWDGFGFVGLPLGLLGWGAALRARRRQAAALALLAVPGVLFALSYSIRDLEVLFLPLTFALALGVGLGLAALERLPGAGRSRALAAAVAVVAVIAPLLLHWPTHDLRRISAAADYARDTLDTVPPGGILFVDGDDSFLLAYLVGPLGERPDVTLYDRAGQLFEDLASGGGSPRRDGESIVQLRLRREVELLQRELGSAGGRPILFMAWPGYELPAGIVLEPVGLLYRVRRDVDSESPVPWDGYREQRVRRQARRLDHPTGLTLAATYTLMRGERALYEGDRRAALALFEEAGREDPRGESTHNYLGTVFGRLGDYRRAIAAFERAVRLQPASVRAWSNLARARGLAGDARGAEQARHRASELSGAGGE